MEDTYDNQMLRHTSPRFVLRHHAWWCSTPYGVLEMGHGLVVCQQHALPAPSSSGLRKIHFYLSQALQVLPLLAQKTVSGEEE